MNVNISTTSNFSTTHLENVSQYISTLIFTFYVIFGNLGNIFKILFFLQKPLKSCPCTVYVLFATISHFFTLNNIPILNLLSNDWTIAGFEQSFVNRTMGQNLDISSASTIKMCKIRIYLHMWSSSFSFQVLVFASINRFCMSLKKKKKNQRRRVSDFFCSMSSAYAIGSTICFIWALISLFYSFNFTIKNNCCTPENPFLWWKTISIVYVCQSILMIIFGTLTILCRQERVLCIRRRCRNHHEMTPMFNQLCQYCRSERSERHHTEEQLTSMIITEIILVVSSTLPYAIYLIYRLKTIETYRSSTIITYENNVEKLIRLTLFFEPSCGFYIYLFTLTSLKQRFFTILRRKLGICE